MKRFVAMLLALMMVLSLIACGSSNTSAPNEPANTTTEPTNTPSEPANQNTEKSIELNIPIDERFTIIEAIYTTKQFTDGSLAVKLKIKNNTEENYQDISFEVGSYDKNGDKQWQEYCYAEIEAGHATWTTFFGTDLSLDNFGSVKIQSYEILKKIDANTVQAIDDVTLDPKPEVLFEQMTEKD